MRRSRGNRIDRKSRANRDWCRDRNRSRPERCRAGRIHCFPSLKPLRSRIKAMQKPEEPQATWTTPPTGVLALLLAAPQDLHRIGAIFALNHCPRRRSLRPPRSRSFRRHRSPPWSLRLRRSDTMPSQIITGIRTLSSPARECNGRLLCHRPGVRSSWLPTSTPGLQCRLQRMQKFQPR